MHRFYISPENWNPDALSLRDAEAHHARDVLRMKRGDRAVLFNGRGREITAEIVDLTGDELRLRKLHETEMSPLRCRITLGQAIPKGKNLDLFVQKAVEIGVAEIEGLLFTRRQFRSSFDRLAATRRHSAEKNSQRLHRPTSRSAERCFNV